MTRLGWGAATLLVFMYKIELLQDSNTPFWSFVVLFLLFFVCEIIPIIATLDYSYMNMIGLDRDVHVGDTVEWFPDQADTLTLSAAPLLLLNDQLGAHSNSDAPQMRHGSQD